MQSTQTQPLEYGIDAPSPPGRIGRFLCGVFGLVMTLCGGLGVIAFAVFAVARWHFDLVMSRQDLIWQQVSAGMSAIFLCVGVYLLRRRFLKTR